MEKSRKTLWYLLFSGVLLVFCAPATAQEAASPPNKAPAPVVKRAVMCEGIQDGLPVNQTIVFTASDTSAYCWSEISPVKADGVVYHEWYHRGVLISRVKLAIHPPRWAVYSSLRLRQADTGPWSLNITDQDGKVLQTLRFSITE